MKILLINPHSKTSFVSPPLGVLYVAASLKEEGHQVFVIDFELEKYVFNKLADFIQKNNIESIGISIVTPKLASAIELAKSIKKDFPEIILFAGGPHARLKPEELTEDCPEFNFIVLGEAELRIKEIFGRLKNKNNFENIDGVAFWQNGRIVIQPPKDYITDLDIIAPPARELVDIKKYSQHLKTSHSPATTMITSRGCPFQCIYCSKPISGLKFRSLSPEKVIAEIKSLIDNFNIKEIIFYDDSFTLDRERVIKICDLIIKEDIKIHWQCETRVNLVDEVLLVKMAQAGCYLIAYGMESGNNRLLQILKKGITIEQIKDAVRSTKKAKIGIIGYFMIGIPGETEAEIKQTVNFAKDLDIDFAQFSIATAYPATELFDIAKSQNKIGRDWSSSLYAMGGKPLVSLSSVPIDKLYSYSRKAYYSFYFRPAYIWKRIKKIKTAKDLWYNLQGIRILLKI